MRTLRAMTCAASAALMLSAPSALASDDAVVEYVPTDLIVGFWGVPTDAQLSELRGLFPELRSWRSMSHYPHYKGDPSTPHPLALVRIATVPEGTDIPGLASRVGSLEWVRYAEPNGIVRIADFIPNDPMWSQQYGPQIIQAPAAWDCEQGSSSVTIAISDTGLNFDHEDLRDNIWINVDEIPNNRIDDDGNGFIDDWRGWDFINGGGDNDPTDGNGHGSHVGGTVAAGLDNGRGIAGLARVKLMAVQCFSAGGGGTWESLAQTVYYATDNDAHALNLSGGGGGGSNSLRDAATYSWQNGMSFVAAAGNNGSSSGNFYPANYPEVISVIATDRNDRRASFSNFGTWCDVSAPGVDILSCYRGGANSYATLSGTSMASPHCAGLVALIKSVDPNTTPQQVRDLLRTYSDDLGARGLDPEYAYGRINAKKVMDAMKACEPPCYADCDKNGVLDIRDFFCFQAAFASQQPYGDCDGNSVFDIRDFFCFQGKYAAGCR